MTQENKSGTEISCPMFNDADYLRALAIPVGVKSPRDADRLNAIANRLEAPHERSGGVAAMNAEYCRGRDDGWAAAMEKAALFMLDRKVSASEFYATELRKLAGTPPHSRCKSRHPLAAHGEPYDCVNCTEHGCPTPSKWPGCYKAPDVNTQGGGVQEQIDAEAQRFVDAGRPPHRGSGGNG